MASRHIKSKRNELLRTKKKVKRDGFAIINHYPELESKQVKTSKLQRRRRKLGKEVKRLIQSRKQKIGNKIYVLNVDETEKDIRKRQQQFANHQQVFGDPIYIAMDIGKIESQTVIATVDQDGNIIKGITAELGERL